MNDQLDRDLETLDLKELPSAEQLELEFNVVIALCEPSRFDDDPELKRKAKNRAKQVTEAYERLKAFIASGYGNSKVDNDAEFKSENMPGHSNEEPDKLFEFIHWASVIIGIGLALLFTLAMGARTAPMSESYQTGIGLIFIGICVLPFLVVALYKVGLTFSSEKSSPRILKKYWINSFCPALVVFSLAMVGQGVLSYIEKTHPDRDEIKYKEETHIPEYETYESDIPFGVPTNVYDPINEGFVVKQGYPRIDGLPLLNNNTLIGIINKINKYDGTISITHITARDDEHVAITLQYDQLSIMRSRFAKSDLKLYDGNSIYFKCEETDNSIEIREGGDWKFSCLVDGKRMAYHPEMMDAIKDKPLVEYFEYISFSAERIEAITDPKWRAYHNQRLSR